jgi:hypothetical protein
LSAKGFRRAAAEFTKGAIANVMDQGAVVHQASAQELLADNIKERYCTL